MGRSRTTWGSLDTRTANDISLKAMEKLRQLNKANDIIGSYVFTILEQHSTLILYPFTNTDIWGFMTTYESRVFSCINTSISLEQQVFVAAHELYHIWFNGVEELVKAQEDSTKAETSLPLNEQKANRFAAEFLVPESLLKMEISAIKIDAQSIGIKEIVRLANSFTVPYRMMVKRLNEINLITRTAADVLLNNSPTTIDQWRVRLGYEPYKPTRSMRMGDLPDLAMEAFEQGLISEDRLEYLIELAGLEVEQVGISLTAEQPLFQGDDSHKGEEQGS